MARERMSGAAYRKQRRERARAERQQAPQAGPPGAPLEAYRNVGEPPQNPTGGIAWANGVAVATLADVIADPLLEPRERRRLVVELTKSIGMTHSRALVEDELAKLRKVHAASPTPSPLGSPAPNSRRARRLQAGQPVPRANGHDAPPDGEAGKA